VASAGSSASNDRRLTATGRALAALALLAASAAALVAEPRLTRFEFEQPHMGTTFRVVLYAADAREASRLAAAAFARIAALDARFSDYRPGSELSRLSDAPAGRLVPVSPDLFRLLEQAQAFSRRSKGAFDITVGPLSRLWRRAHRQRTLPASEELEAARALVGHEQLSLHGDSQSVVLARTGMRLDPGGIAKGFAADAALATLREGGVTRALVAAGGDLAIGEAPPDRPGWRITLAGLDPASEAPGSPLLLARRGVSTSGDTEQWVEIEGRRYSHIVDPRTGLGVQGRSVAIVVAPSATTSDMLATAASVLGPGEGLELVEGVPGAAGLVGARTAGGDRWRKSRGWPPAPAGDSSRVMR